MVAAALSTIHHVASGAALDVLNVSHEFDLGFSALLTTMCATQRAKASLNLHAGCTTTTR
jgi:hypothetical protein